MVAETLRLVPNQHLIHCEARENIFLKNQRNRKRFRRSLGFICYR